MLTDHLSLRPVCDYIVDGIDRKYKTEEEAIAAAEIKHPDCKGHMLLSKIKTKGKVMRYSYTSYQEVVKDGGKRERVRVEIEEPPGRPFLIKRRDFVTDAESDEVDLGSENEQLKQLVGSMAMDDRSKAAEELPFG